jgi:hypothetical protein
VLCILSNLKKEFVALKQDLAMLLKPSVDAPRSQIVGITARPTGEFHKYDALFKIVGISLKDTGPELKHEKSTYYRVRRTIPCGIKLVSHPSISEN